MLDRRLVLADPSSLRTPTFGSVFSCLADPRQSGFSTQKKSPAFGRAQK
ncbi:hypothetical protein SynBIOSE41_04221 [Synechococcus sp. BIOS-E4-1]|nr:hypothetical protein SynBIOSE41_04221 [Synechococcus sp. BIOS-E4-1]